MKDTVRNIIVNNIFMLKIVMRIIPLYVVSNFFLTVLRAVLNMYISIHILKYVVDAIQMRFYYGTVCAHIFFAMGIWIIFKFFESLYNNIYAPLMLQRLKQKMQVELFARVKDMDVDNYDKPEFYNEYILSMENAENRAIEVVNTFSALTYNLAAIFTVVTLIASIDIIGLIFALVNVIAAYWLNIQVSKTNYCKNLELVQPNRVADYVGRVFYMPEYAKEIRTSNVKRVLFKYFDNAIEENKQINKKYAPKLIMLNFYNQGFFRTFLMRGIYLIILVYKLLVTNSISFGSFLALFNGAWEFKNNLEALINIGPKMVESSLYIKQYRTFIGVNSKSIKCSGNEMLPKQVLKIEFRNVGFRYSEDTPYILRNINFVIYPGEKIAIYGLNGAGKSTLIKLLLRLYLVTEGEILLGGKNINTYNLEEYYNYVGVIFQDFQLFAFSIAENVMLGKYTSENERRIKQMLEYVSFDDKLKHMRQGINTYVSKEFDINGVDFSGGERQKIALARTLVQEFAIVVYDEPMSALDPISEYEVNKTIWNSSHGKTVICISHRINANLEADRIFILKDGQIVEGNEFETGYS